MTDYHITFHTSYSIEHQNSPILLDTSETLKYVNLLHLWIIVSGHSVLKILKR